MLNFWRCRSELMGVSRMPRGGQANSLQYGQG